MKTTDLNAFSPAVRAQVEEAIQRALSGIRDPEAMRRACERMDRRREELQKKHGELNIAVDLIRRGRDEA